MTLTIRDSDIAFVVMPWASPEVPLLGASLLLGIVRAAGLRGQIVYPGLELTHLVGWAFYSSMANDMSCYELSEHAFSCYVHGPERVRSAEFFEELRQANGSAYRILGPQPAERFRQIRDEVVPDVIERYANAIAERRVAAVGFSCAFNQVQASLALAKRIKALRPEVRILFGGPSLDAEMGVSHHRRYPEIIDHVFLGEADASMAEIARRVSDGEPLDVSLGVTVRQDGQVRWGELFTRSGSLDDLPVPDYDDFFLQRQELIEAGAALPPVGALSFETSRGCRWALKRACSFCGINGGRCDVRVRAAEPVLRDLDALSNRYGTLNFRANDNLVEMRCFDRLLPRLEASGADYSLALQVRTNLTRAEVAALRRGGVRLIQAGIESFSNHVLKLMRKGVTALQNVQMLKWCREFGINANYFILYGFPGETEEDYDRMAELSALIAHLQPPARMQHVELHRFSPMFDHPDEFGIDDVFLREHVRHVYPDDVLTDDLPYTFRFYSSKTADADTYTARLAVALQEWTSRYVLDPPGPVLEMRHGRDFLLVRDTRTGRETTHCLEGPERLVLLAAESLVRRRRLLETVQSREPGVEHRAVDEAIASLKAKGLLLEERDWLLALPLRWARGS